MVVSCYFSYLVYNCYVTQQISYITFLSTISDAVTAHDKPITTKLDAEADNTTALDDDTKATSTEHSSPGELPGKVHRQVTTAKNSVTSNGVTSTEQLVEGDDATKMPGAMFLSSKATSTVQPVEADDTMKNAIISKASIVGTARRASAGGMNGCHLYKQHKKYCVADGVADRVRYNVASSAVVTSSGKSDGGELLLFVSRLQLLCNSANFLHYVSVYYFRCRHCP
jgi:hypothetical protein